MIHCLDPNPRARQAVLLLHGLGADGTSWTLQLGPLTEAGFRPLAPDIPGFGVSAYDGRGWTPRRIASQMAGLLEELDVCPVDVVGLSMGGIIAQQFALDYPHLIRKLVLVSTFAILRPESLEGWFYFIQRVLLVSTLGLPAQAKLVAEKVFPGPKNETLREMAIASISRADPRAYRAAMRSLALFNSVRRLNEIGANTLIVTGSEDTTVSPLRQRQLARGIPTARQIMIEGAGHVVAIDQPEVFNRELIAFLS